MLNFRCLTIEHHGAQNLQYSYQSLLLMQSSINSGCKGIYCLGLQNYRTKMVRLIVFLHRFSSFRVVSLNQGFLRRA
jgi:hypothetical protein